VSPLCSSCRIRPGTQLVRTGRGGQFASWRCAACLDRRSGSWIKGGRTAGDATTKTKTKTARSK